MGNYCVSDLHGRYDLWEKIKEHITIEDTLYVLGDCADRSKDGWKIIKEVLNMPNCIYLMGNHEKMLLDSMKAYFNGSDSWEFYENHSLLLNNGGKVTFEDWLQEEDLQKWVDLLQGLPYYAILQTSDKKILLTHSGYEPDFTLENNEYLWEKEKEDLVWNRDHYIGKFASENFDLIVHGHTPIEHMIKDIEQTYKFFQSEIKLKEWDKQAYFYCNNTKVNIDSWAVYNGFSILLNLDNLTTIIIEGGKT